MQLCLFINYVKANANDIFVKSLVDYPVQSLKYKSSCTSENIVCGGKLDTIFPISYCRWQNQVNSYKRNACIHFKSNNTDQRIIVDYDEFNMSYLTNDNISCGDRQWFFGF